jgi:hypothetical protein
MMFFFLLLLPGPAPFQYHKHRDKSNNSQEEEEERRRRFVGCDVRVVHGKGTIVVAHNKNMDSILRTGKIRYQRFPHWESELRTVVKLGTLVGQVIYMVMTTSANGYEELLEPLWALMKEFHLKCYPWGVIYRTLRHLDTCRLPIKAEGAKDFTKTWYMLLNGLKLLAAGRSIAFGVLNQHT